MHVATWVWGPDSGPSSAWVGHRPKASVVCVGHCLRPLRSVWGTGSGPLQSVGRRLPYMFPDLLLAPRRLVRGVVKSARRGNW